VRLRPHPKFFLRFFENRAPLVEFKTATLVFKKLHIPACQVMSDTSCHLTVIRHIHVCCAIDQDCRVTGHLLSPVLGCETCCQLRCEFIGKLHIIVFAYATRIILIHGTA